jgi:hypothetical protein
MLNDMLVSVKMKATKKTMIATLMIVMVLATGITPIIAQSDNAPNSNARTGRETASNAGKSRPMWVQRMQQYKENLRQRVQTGTTPEEIDLDDLDEATIATRLAEVEAADEIEGEETIVGGLWILNARGVTVAISPVTDAAETNIRIGLQLVAEKIKATEYGVLYEVHWGRVLHDGENVEIEGLAVLDSDGIFYMALQGEALSFKAIGRIAPAKMGVRVAMKGYMTHDGVEYSHTMRGRAVPFGWYNRLANQFRKRAAQETAPGVAPAVEPSRYTVKPSSMSTA